MILRLEYLAAAEVLLCKQVARLRPHLQLLFIRLYFMTDGAGRFKADAAEIRGALYAHELQQVSQKEVESRLHELHRARLIRLYAEGDRGLGKISDEFWLQRDTKRKVRHPGESKAAAGGDLFAAGPPDESPPALAPKKPKAGVVCVEPPPLTSLPVSSNQARAREATDLRPAAAHLAELQTRYPRHDVPACLRAATRYVHKERGEEAAVTVGWFVAFWMPKAAEKKPVDAAPRETAEQRAAREAGHRQWQAAQREKLTALIAGPEPEPGTLDHAIWLEGRNNHAAA